MKNLKGLKEDFIKRANVMHDGKYDYSLVNYKGAAKPVLIICKRHGIFRQTPSQHLRGKGCMFCATNRLTRDEYLRAVRELFEDKYEYQKCTYSHEMSKSVYITVTCKIHGDFRVRVEDHLKGKGCGKCDKVEKSRTSTNSALNSHGTVDGAPNVNTDKVTYHVVVKFNKKESDTDAFLWSEPFNSQIEAENFITEIKICFDLVGLVSIDAKVIESRGNRFEWEQIAKVVFWLLVNSVLKDATEGNMGYKDFLIGEIAKRFNNEKDLFTESDVDMVLSFLNSLGLKNPDLKMCA